MTYRRKRKILWTAVAAVLVLAMTVTVAVLLLRDDTEYTDFKTRQFQPVDMELFGLSSVYGNGLNCRALWIGEGYTCTMEQDGQRGERISVPYVEWEFTNVATHGCADIYFRVAERAFVDGEVRNAPSPWRYSNIEITVVVGEQTGLNGYYMVGRISQGKTVLEDQTPVSVEVAELGTWKTQTAERAEADLSQKRQTKVYKINSSRFFTSTTQAIQVRLPENRSWRNPGYHLEGGHPEPNAVFGLSCDLSMYNRYGSSKTEFPQTAYFKVTYDVENTVTGERTTQSTGWIQRDYTARIH